MFQNCQLNELFRSQGINYVSKLSVTRIISQSGYLLCFKIVIYTNCFVVRVLIIFQNCQLNELFRSQGIYYVSNLSVTRIVSQSGYLLCFKIVSYTNCFVVRIFIMFQNCQLNELFRSQDIYYISKLSVKRIVSQSGYLLCFKIVS